MYLPGNGGLLYRFCRGGLWLIITEGTYTDDQFSKAYFNQPGLINQQQLEAWSTIVRQVKQRGTLFICQLMHAGALSQYHSKAIAPSAIQPLGVKMPEVGGEAGPFPLPGEANPAQILAIKQGFVAAALKAEEAGFDGVELHAANGYLFDQFITDYTNKRTDAYGGTVENRLLLLAEVYVAIRAVVQPRFVVGIRFSEGKVNNLAYRWPGGAATARAIFREVKKFTPDYVHIAAEGGRWERECLYPSGTSSNRIAKQLLGVPIIANGGMHNLELAARLIEQGDTDLVSIGRAAIANPDWPKRIMEGRTVIPFHQDMIKPSVSLKNTKQFMAKGSHAAEDIEVSYLETGLENLNNES
ncbi:NADH:flavin oxidoreductase [Algoriphagus boritolerans]|uniref:NADH:flavin oxidoreductase n=1 Tax=Algoriphagus boritolerans TaxID=308111 RepID=UPI002FCE49B2